MSVLTTSADECPGFDRFAGRLWIYPNNLTVRPYQKTAVSLALFSNSMIVLPTGFGKTFIAAVVMYNFYRWYPRGKIIFVAPTRPLVAQQIEECKKISGIPSKDCIELTGTISSNDRRSYWIRKRVIFATPQVIQNDLQNGLVSPDLVKSIVIDEAHKAQGNYAYVEIVRMLHHGNKNRFRVLALSATPGSNIEKVKQVMINLFIKEVMFRREDSLDLVPFKNSKISKAWTVQLNSKHMSFVQKFKKITDPIFKELYKAGLTYSCDSVERASRYVLLQAKTRLQHNDVSTHNIGARKGKLMHYCSAAMSLSYAFELLTGYGIRVFYSYVKKKFQENRSTLRTALAGQVEFTLMMKEIESMFGDDAEPNPDKVATVDPLQGHAKLFVVKDLLMKHFESHKEVQTRAIVFAKYRESVLDIVQTLKAFEPTIRASTFVGQGTGNGNNSGMKQKEQIQAIKEFKTGKYNVLVATCVAEEGLDIGEVDLIICYDTSVSPISNTQRRGRTGRKRSGDVHTLVTKDYEEKKLSKAGNSRRLVEDQLYNKDNYSMCRYKESPRMVPIDMRPECLEQKIFQVEEAEEEEEIGHKPKRKRRKKEPASEVVEKPRKKKCFEEDSDDQDVMDKPCSKRCSDEEDTDIDPHEVTCLDDDDDDEDQEEKHDMESREVKCSDQIDGRMTEACTKECPNQDDDDIVWEDF